MNELLITEQDLRTLAVLPANVDFERFANSVLKAQRGEIRSALGEALYYDVYTNPGSTANAVLIAGSGFTYNGKTIAYFGLKPAICFYAYAHFLNDNYIRATRTGNVVKLTDVSEQATAEQVQDEYHKALHQAGQYMLETLRYLQENRSTYPLFQPKQATTNVFVASLTKSEFGLPGIFIDGKIYPYGY